MSVSLIKPSFRSGFSAGPTLACVRLVKPTGTAAPGSVARWWCLLMLLPLGVFRRCAVVAPHDCSAQAVPFLNHPCFQIVRWFLQHHCRVVGCSVVWFGCRGGVLRTTMSRAGAPGGAASQ